MNIKTLTERIENAEKKIQKKQATIAKKQKWIADKTAKLETMTDDHERYWAECDIRSLKEDIVRIEKEIKETEKTLENYRKQYDGEIEREKSWIDEVPEVLKSFQNELVEEWDAHDIAKKERILEAIRTMPYEMLKEMYHWRDRDWAKYTTDEQIHESNEKDATSLILNLVNRVKDVTGEITDWSGLTLAQGTWGMTVLNGWVSGKEGRCCVESIGAGGYNIQRYHIRVLVKPIN